MASPPIDNDPVSDIARRAFDGLLVRKVDVRDLARNRAVPPHVVECLLGQCLAEASSPEEAVARADAHLSKELVPPGNEELVKATAKQEGTTHLIDQVRVRLDPSRDAYRAHLSTLGLRGVRIGESLVLGHRRLLQDGLYAKVALTYDPSGSSSSRPGAAFVVESIEPMQTDSANALDRLCAGRSAFSPEEWLCFLTRSVGLEPSRVAISFRCMTVLLLRLVPFVEANYHLVELGPPDTGKSFLFDEFSPYARVLSGGTATAAQLFVDVGTGERGLVAVHDVVCFDEVSTTTVEQEAVSGLKGYMASGGASRGRETIQGRASIVFLGNLEGPDRPKLRPSHLFAPFPTSLQSDVAFMDRIHAFLPGWEMPTLRPDLFTEALGLTSSFFTQYLRQLRRQNRRPQLRRRVHLEGNFSQRDEEAVWKTLSGLTKLMAPDPETDLDDESLRWMTLLALESRLRVRAQQHHLRPERFDGASFRFRLRQSGQRHEAALPALPDDLRAE